MKGWLAFSFIVLLLLTGAPSSASAQVLYGSLLGDVTDETGSAVPGAAVMITQRETPRFHTGVTDSGGAYHFTLVQSGTYTITVKLSGFRTVTRVQVPLTLNNVTRVDVSL